MGTETEEKQGDGKCDKSMGTGNETEEKESGRKKGVKQKKGSKTESDKGDNDSPNGQKEAATDIYCRIITTKVAEKTPEKNKYILR